MVAERKITMIRSSFVLIILFVVTLFFLPNINDDLFLHDKDSKGFSVRKFDYIQADSLSRYVNINIDTYQIEDTSLIADRINRELIGIKGSLDNDAEKNLDQFVQNSVNEVKKLIADFPNDQLYPYVYKVHSKVFQNNKKLFSFEVKYYRYTGGAHGNNDIKYHNYDLLKGEKLSLEDLFTKKELILLTSMAELQFRRIKKIPVGKTPKEMGFWFDQFYITNDFLLGTSKIIFYYAPYEIAPYAMGDTKVELSYKDIKSKLPESSLFQFVN